MRLIDVDELKKCAVKVCFADMPKCVEFDAVGVPVIDIMPTIDPESLRPTAHWIAEFVSEVYGPEAAYGGRGDYICGFYCSNCHNEAILNEAGEDFTPKFCPECGARMVNAGD